MLLEDAGPLSDLGKPAVPVVGRPDRKLEIVLCKCAQRNKSADEQGRRAQGRRQKPHESHLLAGRGPILKREPQR
jgi:hypothetical protein